MHSTVLELELLDDVFTLSLFFGARLPTQYPRVVVMSAGSSLQSTGCSNTITRSVDSFRNLIRYERDRVSRKTPKLFSGKLLLDDRMECYEIGVVRYSPIHGNCDQRLNRSGYSDSLEVRCHLTGPQAELPG